MEAKALAKKSPPGSSSRSFPAGRLTLLLASSVLLFSTACSRPREITSLQRKEAATLASEAQFAMTLRDFPRTEGLLAKAVALAPDEAELWVNLGEVRVQMKNRDGAKAAYRSALSAYEESARKNPTDPGAVIQQIYVLALLGDVKEARARLEKARKKYPDDRDIRVFIEEKRLDAMMAEPSFKDIAL